jgi:NifB/MoaA-like Fe-S oxidoreductase
MWVPHIDCYVDEILRLEGRGDANNQSLCAGTNCEASIEKPGTGFRCKDCQDLRMFCVDCIISSHRSQPFHHIRVSTTKNI